MTTKIDRIGRIEHQLGANGTRAIAEQMARRYSDEELDAMTDRQFFAAAVLCEEAVER